MDSFETSGLITKPNGDHEDGKLKRWKFFTLILLLVTYTGAYLTYNCLSVATPMITSQLGYTNEQIGRVLTISTGARIIPKLFSGVIVDYIGGKTMMLIGLLGMCFGGFIFPLGTSLWWWTIVWSIVRISLCFPWPGLVKITSKWFRHDEMGKAMSILSLSFLFGSGISVLYLDLFVFFGVNYQGLFAIGAATLFVIIIIALLFVKESPTKIGYSEPEPDPTNVFGSESGAESTPQGWKEVLLPIATSGSFWLMLLLYMGIYLIRQVYLDWTPQYLTQQTGCSDAVANIGFLVFTFVGGFSALLMGYLNDKFNQTNRNCTLCIFLCFLTLSLFATAMVNLCESCGNIYVYFALISLSSFFLLGPYTLPSAAMSVRFGGRKICATVSALMDGFGSLASMLSGTMGSLSDSGVNGWAKVWLVMSFVSLFITLLSVLYIWVDNRNIQFLCAQSCKDFHDPEQNSRNKSVQ